MQVNEMQDLIRDCINGRFPPCAEACPLKLDIRSFMARAREGKWNAAHRIMRKSLVFPGFICQLCAAPCEHACYQDAPVSIRALIEACTKFATSLGPDVLRLPAKSQRVAVIGAGLSGLACALRMAGKKYTVDVYEKAEGWGGALRDNPKADEYLAELTKRFSTEKVNFFFDTEICDIGSLDHDAIYIATGSGGDDFGLGEDRPERVFLGGGLRGADAVEAVAQGVEASVRMEMFLITGHDNTKREEQQWAAELPRPQPGNSPRIIEPDGEFDSEQAVAEANRCHLCDCTLCVDTCEMLGSYKKLPLQMVKEIGMDNETIRGLSGRTMTRQVSSCTNCGTCKKVCPVDIDMGAINMAVRENRENRGDYPAAFHDFWLRELEFHSDGEAVWLPAGENKCDYLFFPGCQLGAADPRYVEKGLDYLQRHLERTVGLSLGCCGIPAYWAGKREQFEAILARHREQWAALGRPTLVTACATCAGLFRTHLPEIPQISLYELMAEHGVECDHGAMEAAAVFDPCTAGEEMAAAVRSMAGGMGIQLTELYKRGSDCCGWGGHITPANPEVAKTIAKNRGGDSELAYITYCVNCRDNLAGEGKQCVHILDLAFDLDDGYRGKSGINLRRKNSIQLRSAYMNMAEKQDELHDRIVIPDELRDRMEQKMVLLSDLYDTVAEALETGKGLTSLDTGHSVYARETRNLTYWVEYSQDEDGLIRVHNAYCHRMRILNR